MLLQSRRASNGFDRLLTCQFGCRYSAGVLKAVLKYSHSHRRTCTNQGPPAAVVKYVLQPDAPVLTDDETQACSVARPRG